MAIPHGRYLSWQWEDGADIRTSSLNVANLLLKPTASGFTWLPTAIMLAHRSLMLANRSLMLWTRSGATAGAADSVLWWISYSLLSWSVHPPPGRALPVTFCNSQAQWQKGSTRSKACMIKNKKNRREASSSCKMCQNIPLI